MDDVSIKMVELNDFDFMRLVQLLGAHETFGSWSSAVTISLWNQKMIFSFIQCLNERSEVKKQGIFAHRKIENESKIKVN